MMREIWADFNARAENNTLHLVSKGSLVSIAKLAEPLDEGEHVWLTDGELRVEAQVFFEKDHWMATSTWTSWSATSHI
jgi:hypothetical protein